MSLRVKFLLIFTVTIVLLGVLVMSLVKMIVERQFTTIEIERMEKQITRLSDSLQVSLQQLGLLAKEWASQKPLSAQKSLAFHDRLKDWQVDFVAVWDPQRGLIFSRSLPADSTREGYASEDFFKALEQAATVQLSDVPESLTGMVWANNRLIQIASYPISSSDSTSNAMAYLIVGRYMSFQRFSGFEKSSGYKLRFQQVSTPSITTSLVDIVDEELLIGYLPVTDLHGNVIALINVMSHRELHADAAQTIRVFLLSLASAAGILFFLVWYLFDISFVIPVRRLGDQLEVATRHSLLASDLAISGGELGRLARRIETLVRTVTYTEKRYRRLFETATDGILIVDFNSQKITDANRCMEHLLHCAYADLIDRTLSEVSAFKNPRILKSLSRFLQSNPNPHNVEIELTQSDRESLFLEVTATTHEVEGLSLLQLNFRDISLRRRAHEELRRLSGHLLRLQDEERRRIARELHDSTAQTLSALQMAITQLTPYVNLSESIASQTLEEIRSLCDASLKEIRTISYLLHPPLLDEVGLIFALRWYVDGFMTRTEKIVHLDVPKDLPRLPSEIETTIFRIVQEGLSNIHRHSGSRRAWIKLSQSSTALELRIRDEGRGMELSEDGKYSSTLPVPGVGITGMRERLRQFNGTLKIESSRKGTLIVATLPFDLNRHETQKT